MIRAPRLFRFTWASLTQEILYMPSNAGVMHRTRVQRNSTVFNRTWIIYFWKTSIQQIHRRQVPHTNMRVSLFIAGRVQCAEVSVTDGFDGGKNSVQQICFLAKESAHSVRNNNNITPSRLEEPVIDPEFTVPWRGPSPEFKSKTPPMTGVYRTEGIYI